MNFNGDFPSGTRDVSAAVVRVAAMNHLARREHAAEELCEKLGRRFDDQRLVAQVVARLREENLQSDERFTEAFVTMRTRQGKGPLRIVQELKQKGVSESLIEARVNPEDSQWWDLARDVKDKRFGPDRPLDSKGKARQIRFLQYRGFTGAQIRALI